MTEQITNPRSPEQELSEAAEQAPTPRVYVASLSDYNAGRLHGRWLDALDEQTLQSGVQDMLARSPEPGAEEFAVHDYEYFGGIRLDEYENLATVVRLARGLKAHGPAFAAWTIVAGTDEACAESFRAHHLGSWADIDAYVDELALDLGIESFLTGVPPPLQPYVRIDVAALVRDELLSGELVAHQTCDSDGQTAVHLFLPPGTG